MTRRTRDLEKVWQHIKRLRFSFSYCLVKKIYWGFVYASKPSCVLASKARVYFLAASNPEDSSKPPPSPATLRSQRRRQIPGIWAGGSLLGLKMGNGPAPFSDIGKRARDLLTKDYNFDQKVTLITLSDNGLGLTATGVKIGQLFIGDISTQHKSGKATVDVKVDTNSNVSSTVTVNELVAGVKTSFSFKIPDQKSGKLDVQYLHDHAAINSSIGLTPTPVLELAAAVGSKELALGAEVGFDSASASFTKYNAGIGFNNHDLSAALILADKGETLKASYVHVVNPMTGAAVAAEIIHRFNTYENSFTFGSCHSLNPLTTVKTRFNNSGKASILCQHEWRPKSFITLSAEYDPKAISTPSRVGLALALKPRLNDLS